MKKVVHVEVRVNRRDSVEAMIKRFAKKVKKSGILKQYIEHSRMPDKKKRRKKK